MAFTGRRVVTGHAPDGKSEVLFDSTLTLFDGAKESGKEARSGSDSRVFWVTRELPANNDGNSDEATQDVPTALENGTVLRIVTYSPGVSPRHHRTNSIDYAVVLSGSMQVELDEQTVELNEGDVLIQRGTLHNWINNSGKPCTMLFAMTGAKPANVGGKPLPAQG